MDEINEPIVFRKRKYSLEDKIKVLKLSEEGKTPREISQLTGVTTPTVYDWTTRRRSKKEQNKKPLSNQKSNNAKPQDGKITSAEFMGFRELKLIENNEGLSQKAMIQICSPDGFTMLIPSLDEKILSLFFSLRSKCL